MSRQLPKGARIHHGRIEAVAKYRGARKWARFALTVSNADIRAWQHDAMRDLEDVVDGRVETGGAKTGGRLVGGTLERDIAEFLPRIKGRPSYPSDRSSVRAWLLAYGRDKHTPLGQLPRDRITTADIDIVIGEWMHPSSRGPRRITITGYSVSPQTGHLAGRTFFVKGYERTPPITSSHAAVAANTVRRRCQVLHELYRTLDGDEASPIRGAKVPKVPKPHPVSVPIDTILGVARALAQAEDDKTYARFLVLNTTGQRPCQVKAAQPLDVNLRDRTWIVRAAKGAPAHTVYLNDEMLGAWRTFIAADAWGTFNSSDYGVKLHAAGWPRGVRPYNARHSVIMAAIRGAGLGAGQALAGHSTPETTRKHYAGVLVEEAMRAAEAVAGRLKGIVGPGRVVNGGANASGAPQGRAERAGRQDVALAAGARPEAATGARLHGLSKRTCQRRAAGQKLPPTSSARATANRRKLAQIASGRQRRGR